MFTTILLSALITLTLSAVVYFCVKSYKSRSDKRSQREEITESMIRNMLMEKGCNIIEDEGNPDWIRFEKDAVHYFIRIRGMFCEVHCAMQFSKENYDPALTQKLVDNEMRNITCCHMWYDEEHSSILSTVFSIQKTYDHLQSSFYDMIQCIYYGYNVFNDFYQNAAKQMSNDNKYFS
jgi:hypothetical protein